MSDDFPTRFVFGALVLTPLVILTFPISLPVIGAVAAMRHGVDRFDNHSGTRGPVSSHAYQNGFGSGSMYSGAPSHGFMSSIRSRF